MLDTGCKMLDTSGLMQCHFEGAAATEKSYDLFVSAHGGPCSVMAVIMIGRDRARPATCSIVM
jgi:hypothetical protein